MKRININTILALLGAVAVFAPDIATVATWLAGSGITWLGTVARVLGFAAALLASLPRIVKMARPVLATMGLATSEAGYEVGKAIDAEVKADAVAAKIVEDALTSPQTPSAKGRP